jgi:hypothetical protein
MESVAERRDPRDAETETSSEANAPVPGPVVFPPGTRRRTPAFLRPGIPSRRSRRRSR